MYSSHNSVLHGIRNLPIPVNFAGFTSDTCQLQQAGWELSVMQTPLMESPECGIQLAMRFPTSGESFYAVSRHASYRHWHQAIMNGDDDSLRHLQFDIVCVNNDIRCTIMPMPSSAMTYGFKAFDAQPTYRHEEIELKDLVPFKTLKDTSQEIWIPENKIAEAITRITELQVPAQQDILDRKRKETGRQEFKNSSRESLKAQLFIA